MSFIDLIGILLSICLCYIGYLKGVKGKLFFLISFFSSAFLMYFGFNFILELFFKTFKSKVISGILISIIIIIPAFIVIELGVKKLFIDDKKSFSITKYKVSNSSRILGALIGFIGGYIFMFFMLVISENTSIEKSYFYHFHKKPEGILQSSTEIAQE